MLSDGEGWRDRFPRNGSSSGSGRRRGKRKWRRGNLVHGPDPPLDADRRLRFHQLLLESESVAAQNPQQIVLVVLRLDVVERRKRR